MTCALVQRQFTRYMEHMCGKSEVATIARHIESCRACAQQLAELQQVKSVIHQLPEVNPGPFTLSDMTTAIRERTTSALPGTGRRGKFTLFEFRTRYVIAAAAVVILTAATITWQLFNTPSPSIVQNQRTNDEINIYLQEHALHADQSVFSNGAFGSVMVDIGKK